MTCDRRQATLGSHGIVEKGSAMYDMPLMEQLAAALASSDDFRVLRRVDLDRIQLASSPSADTSVGVVIDVETTGLDPARDRCVELALRRFGYDSTGTITWIDRAHSWLEDPGHPLAPNIVALTGITDAEIAGHAIDEVQAVDLISSADVRVAFNAAFDRRFIERRLPAVAGLAWACAMREVDWNQRLGGGGRVLGWLLAQSGFFHGAHRATADVDATVVLLQNRKDGTTALAELLETASRPTWIVSACGAHFDVKDRLRERGYRWRADKKVWSTELSDADKPSELSWLEANVYAPGCKARGDGPEVRAVSWLTRHG